MKKIRPLHDYVLVKRAKPDEKSRGGIIVPEIAQERPQQGEVLAVGPGRVLASGEILPVDVAKGDVVLFGKHVAATDVAATDDPDIVLVREGALLAVMTP